MTRAATLFIAVFAFAASACGHYGPPERARPSSNADASSEAASVETEDRDAPEENDDDAR